MMAAIEHSSRPCIWVARARAALGPSINCVPDDKDNYAERISSVRFRKSANSCEDHRASQRLGIVQRSAYPAEGDAVVVGGEETTIGDGDAVGISG